MSIGFVLQDNKYIIQIEIINNIQIEINNNLNMWIDYIYLDTEERQLYSDYKEDPINKKYISKHYKILCIYDIKNNKYIKSIEDYTLNEIYSNEIEYYLSKERALVEIPLSLLPILFTNGICENRKTYYDNGFIFEEYFHNNGIIEGIYKKYYNNGNLQVECNYINNKINGIYKEYDRNGIYKEYYI
jgi:antitoxin component YwqK of YwqJK toxin-antitoxin module